MKNELLVALQLAPATQQEAEAIQTGAMDSHHAAEAEKIALLPSNYSTCENRSYTE